MKEVVSAYADKADVKKVQSDGFHIAGHRYVTIKADERSLYGKKVRALSIRARLEVWRADSSILLGEGRRGHRKDNSSYPCHSLPGNGAARRSGQHGRTARRLSHQRWLLSFYIDLSILMPS